MFALAGDYREQQQLYASTNQGQCWQNTGLTSNITSNPLEKLAVSPDYLIDHTVFALFSKTPLNGNSNCSANRS
jgi:hypothetical protein